MSVVEDLLKLPSLGGASVAAGKSGFRSSQWPADPLPYA